MKKLMKIAAAASLLIIACFMISACGDDAENIAQGKGQVDITTTNSVTTLALGAVTVQVSETNGGAIFDTVTTGTDGKVTWTGPTGSIGSDYFFTFSKDGYATQSNIAATPNSTGSNVKLNVPMVPNLQ